MDNPLREVIRIFGLVERAMQPYFARFGISGSQWGVLRILDRCETDGLRLSDLSERLLIRPPSVTGLIDRLVRSGLVRRVASAADLRVRRIQLTAAGRRLVDEVLAVHQEQLNKVLGGLSQPEQAELSRLLSKWGQHLQEMLHERQVMAVG